MGISVASNAISGAMSAKDAKRQHQYDLEKMATQHGYNIENQRRAKEMWNYTNFENQKQHLLNAGLSPGLFYGGGGAGGASTSGGQGQGIGLGTETGVGYGIQQKLPNENRKRRKHTNR